MTRTSLEKETSKNCWTKIPENKLAGEELRAGQARVHYQPSLQVHHPAARYSLGTASPLETRTAALRSLSPS